MSGPNFIAAISEYFVSESLKERKGAVYACDREEQSVRLPLDHECFKLLVGLLVMLLFASVSQ